jgi:L-fucose isomerase-like protein
MARATLAVIVGNRDFFPDKLVTEARRDIQALFAEMDIDAVMLDETATKLGGVETWDDAKRCAELFRQHAGRIDGILVCLPNFGDEKGVADTIKLSGLNVPILVQAYPDNLDQFSVERRRDAFCGKVSACNNLRQYGFPFTLTDLHTVHPLTPAFRRDLEKFLGVCRIVNGLRTARLGAIGARPGAFNTVRYSEKLLQAHGMSVQTLDLSEVLGWVQRLPEDDARVEQKLADIKAYADYGSVPPPSLVKMARLGVVIEDWMDKNDLTRRRSSAGPRCSATLASTSAR